LKHKKGPAFAGPFCCRLKPREAKKGLKPAAPSGRNRQAERRESQGAAASRDCEFPGSAAQRNPLKRQKARISAEPKVTIEILAFSCFAMDYDRDFIPIP